VGIEDGDDDDDGVDVSEEKTEGRFAKFAAQAKKKVASSKIKKGQKYFGRLNFGG
jgi:hypothetical protein